jgi:hypothetical protein
LQWLPQNPEQQVKLALPHYRTMLALLASLLPPVQQLHRQQSAVSLPLVKVGIPLYLKLVTDAILDNATPADSNLLTQLQEELAGLRLEVKKQAGMFLRIILVSLDLFSSAENDALRKQYNAATSKAPQRPLIPRPAKKARETFNVCSAMGMDDNVEQFYAIRVSVRS